MLIPLNHEEAEKMESGREVGREGGGRREEGRNCSMAIHYMQLQNVIRINDVDINSCSCVSCQVKEKSTWLHGEKCRSYPICKF